jgi:phenylalanine ammonia-lyase
VLEVIMALIDHTVTPIIPLRGSISASGDLSPLSYIAGVLEANPDIYVQFGEGSNQRIISSDKALELLGRSPIKLRPKEGLGLVNGTAVCTSVASLALWEANHLAVLSQACTAMATEALRGHAESFHPFIAEVRPHPGQIEAARNIYGFLTGSRLAKGANPIYVNGMPQIGRELPVAVSHNILAQDRYAIRTASQWIGPQLEDLLLAHQQIYTELNATTDNPLIDMTSGVPRFFNGGNFQAASITSAMEKTRSALQMLGKMIFAQCTEIIDPAFNNGLPANLAADDPSLSFTCKGKSQDSFICG